MTPELRRGLAALLAGVAASLAALLTSTTLRARACTSAGGQWADAARTCTLPPGVQPPATWGSSLAAAIVGVMTLTLLWRTYSFFAGRRRPT